MPRTRTRVLPTPQVYEVGGWLGMDDTPEPVAADLRFAGRAQNVYLPPKSAGTRYVGRPGTSLAGAQLGTLGNRTAQFVGQLTKQDGTEYTVEVLQGEVYTYSWGSNAWAKVVSTANLTTASITLSGTARVHGVVFANTLVLSDGVNTPFTWDGTSGAGGLVKLTNAPVFYGQPVVYYSKLFAIKAAERDTMVWSEEATANTGYEAGGYTNAWTVPNPVNDRMVALAADNASLTVLWTRSATTIQGAVSTDFATAGTRASVSATIGTGSPSSVRALDEGVFHVDQDGRPHIIPAGASQPMPLYERCREFLSGINRTALDKVLVVEDRATETLKVGYVGASSTYVDTWLVYTRDGGKLTLTGTETGYTAQAAGMVKNGSGRWVWMHAGADDGYAYAHGTPDDGPWTDASGSSTLPITRDLWSMPMGNDADAEKLFDQVSVQGYAATDQTVTVNLETNRGAALGLTVTLAGDGAAFDSAVFDTDVFAQATNDRRTRIGFLRRGRWAILKVSQASTSQQFGIEGARVVAFTDAMEPSLV